MSAYFLDSSALVKRYAQEQGTAFIITLLKPPRTPKVWRWKILIIIRKTYQLARFGSSTAQL